MCLWERLCILDLVLIPSSVVDDPAISSRLALYRAIDGSSFIADNITIIESTRTLGTSSIITLMQYSVNRRASTRATGAKIVYVGTVLILLYFFVGFAISLEDEDQAHYYGLSGPLSAIVSEF